MKRLGEEQVRGLAQCWARHRLAVAAPERFASWDWVILTAASEPQARLYDLALDEARGRGVLASATQTLVVPDPGGRRIGSGGATLNALRAAAAIDAGLGGRRVLLIHSGGDSRRVPWANIFGKAFVPLPVLADPDHAPPTVFDHLLAVSAAFAFAMDKGGMVTLSGDMLLLFDPARVDLPADGAAVITTPVPLDLAGKHGVIVDGGGGRVARLLQKATPGELAEAGALIEGGSALLDTGIWAFTGGGFQTLVNASAEHPGAYDALLESGDQCSLYEELAGAMVEGERAALDGRPWSRMLLRTLGGVDLEHRCADDMVFLHFGTTAEILSHLDRPWSGGLMSRILAESGPKVSPDAHLLETALHVDAQVGWGSLLYGCRFGAGAAIGRRCVAIGIDDGGETIQLPDHTCLWQVPLADTGNGPCVAHVCCGVDDNPGEAGSAATFCNRDFALWMRQHGVTPEDLWADGDKRILWFARLFSVLSAPASLQTAMWLVGPGDGPGADRLRAEWRAAERLHLADLHRRADFPGWMRQKDTLRASLLLQALGRTVDGALDRNVYELARQIRAPGLRRRAMSLADRRLGNDAALEGLCPRSRRLQMRSDLLAAGGSADEARAAAADAFAAVQDEVAAAVRYQAPEPVRGLSPARVEVALPVRFDISGGWSDTPPYCLERPAMVLNLALRLNGARPVRAQAETIDSPRWELNVEDLGQSRVFESTPDGVQTDGFADPFHLLKTALRVTGFGDASGITQGVRLRTRAAVPKGSGLGTSSILGAAVIRALQRLAGRPDDTRTVSDLVLVLEQQMRTGGGWQDQVGGLVPGVKCVRTDPVRPLRMKIENVPLLPAAIDEFQARFVVAFTGKQRLARNILQLVVERYLRRDARTLDAIGALVELAEEGRAALAMGRLDDLGAVLCGAWSALQQLTSESSNPQIDALFREVEDLSVGGKLAGAGGGGFMGVLAKDGEAAARIRRRLEAFDSGLRVYDWTLDSGGPAEEGFDA